MSPRKKNTDRIRLSWVTHSDDPLGVTRSSNCGRFFIEPIDDPPGWKQLATLTEDVTVSAVALDEPMQSSSLQYLRHLAQRISDHAMEAP